jgi:2-polyprenyl-3-methyl-5-hydroxy-6-metoxy-1,4-benzoquinol methylase
VTLAKLVRKLIRTLFRYDPSFVDMHDDERAHRAAAEYLEHIQRHLREAFGDRRLDVLDAGCQAGRLLIPLAEQGHRTIGIDTSGMSLARARRHARTRGLRVRLHRGDIAQLRRWVKPSSLDVILCTEVLYLCRDYRQILERFVESLRPGGLLCISHRPQTFYAAIGLERGLPEAAERVLQTVEGPSPEADYHNWQTPDQLAELYSCLGVRLLGCYAVDHAQKRIPDTAEGAAARRALEAFHVEGPTFRVPSYILVIAQRPV